MDGEKLLKALSKKERSRVLRAFSDQALAAEVVRRQQALAEGVGQVATEPATALTSEELAEDGAEPQPL